MRVAVASVGRFHAFDLARQLDGRGMLERLFTAYWRHQVEQIDSTKTGSFPIPYTFHHFLQKGGVHRFDRQLSRFVIGSFDRWVGRSLGPGDVFHSLSGFSTGSHRIARERWGMVTVCDRGSTHIAHQNDVLKEENERWGISRVEVDPWIIDREEAEYEECDRILVPTRFVAQTFLRRGVPSSKVRRAPYGVDLELFRRVQPRDTEFRVLFAGAVSIRKGVLYLLEAMQGLPKSEYKLWLAGAMQDEIRPLLAKYEGCFEYLGAVPRRELATYYSRASVLVLPSLEEGLALVQAQAMACGLPVIATPNTGAEDLFEDGVQGFHVPVRSPQAIRARIVQLREDAGLWEQFSEAATLRVQANRGWAEYGSTIVAHYAEASAGKGISSANRPD